MSKPLERFEVLAREVDAAHGVLMKIVREAAPSTPGIDISEQAHRSSLDTLRKCLRQDLAQEANRSAAMGAVMTYFYASAAIIDGFDEAIPMSPEVPITYEWGAFIVTKRYYLATAALLKHASLCLVPFSSSRPN